MKPTKQYTGTKYLLSGSEFMNTFPVIDGNSVSVITKFAATHSSSDSVCVKCRAT